MLNRSLFVYNKNNAFTWLLTYVDDIIIKDFDHHICEVKIMLMKHFMMDLGEFQYFLGLDIDRKGDTLTLTQ